MLQPYFIVWLGFTFYVVTNGLQLLLSDFANFIHNSGLTITQACFLQVNFYTMLQPYAFNVTNANVKGERDVHTIGIHENTGHPTLLFSSNRSLISEDYGK
jgi:hypothetical protein